MIGAIMWNSLLVALIVAINLITSLDSYKLPSDNVPKIIESYEEGTARRDDLTEQNHSNEERSAQRHGQRVIGKWRNNGQALEPKWRDGDSVPLAPFSMAKFENGWRRKTTAILASTSDDQVERERVRDGRRSKYFQETLENHPDEYELIENDNDNPRPRKRRPPQSSEFVEARDSYPSFRDSSENDFDKLDSRTKIGKNPRKNSTTNQDSRPSGRNDARAPETEALKSFLKMQRGNLSLSEILQQKNLTLADLLKGNANAIDALKSESRLSTPNEKTVIPNREPIAVLPEEIPRDVIFERPRWMPRRTLVVRKMNRYSNLEGKNNTNDGFNLKLGVPIIEESTDPVERKTEGTEAKFSTRVTKPMSEQLPSEDQANFAQTMRSKEKIETTTTTELVESDKYEKQLENGESSFVETTTMDEKVSDYSPDNEQRFVTTSDKMVSTSHDEDEIMEFSDFPGKISQFMPVSAYETTVKVNTTLYPGYGSMKTNDAQPLRHGFGSSTRSVYYSTTNPSITSQTDAEDIYEESSEIKTGDIVGTITTTMADFKTVTSEMKPTEIPRSETTNPIASHRSNVEPGSKETDAFLSENPGAIGDEDETVEFNEDAARIERAWKKRTNSTSNQKLYDAILPKVDSNTRAEILELFSSGSSAERLERLLASRNMSIEELIALRQRGSSQVHLAEVFKTRAPTTRFSESETRGTKQNLRPDENMPRETSTLENTRSESSTSTTREIERDLVDNIEFFFSDQKNFKSNGWTFDKIVQISDVVQNLDAKPSSGRSGGRRDKYEEIKRVSDNSESISSPGDFPLANGVQRDSQGSSYYTSIEKVEIPAIEKNDRNVLDFAESAISARANSTNPFEIGRVREIIDRDLRFNSTVYQTIDEREYYDKKTISKVKPSIIASGGILGVTIVVFLSIFIACRIRQKKKFNYRNKFSKTVFQNPVMTARKLSNTSSVNTIMVDVVATSTAKRSSTQNHCYDDEEFEAKSDIENDSLDANDSWDTIPDFMK